jgi:hypothetical protein
MMGACGKREATDFCLSDLRLKLPEPKAHRKKTVLLSELSRSFFPHRAAPRLEVWSWRQGLLGDCLLHRSRAFPSLTHGQPRSAYPPP